MDVGESCWGQGQPLRQEQWSGGEWGYGGDRRQGFQVHLTCDFQTGFKVEFIKHFWRVWWGTGAKGASFAYLLNSLMFTNVSTETQRWDEVKLEAEQRSSEIMISQPTASSHLTLGQNVNFHYDEPNIQYCPVGMISGWLLAVCPPLSYCRDSKRRKILSSSYLSPVTLNPV